MKTIRYNWETLMQKLMSKDYRFEPIEEFEYPIYKRCIYKANFYTGCVVKFTGETEGVIVKDTERTREFDHHIGYRLDTWIPHTDINAWEDCDYVEPIYYYRWERRYSTGIIESSDLVTDLYAKTNEYELLGWFKVESSKRTWELAEDNAEDIKKYKGE